jgi:hypothetical protein
VNRRHRSRAESLIGGCFTFFDFYIGPYGSGVRPFDLLGFGVLGAARLSDTTQTTRWSAWRRVGIALVLASLGWALALSALQDPSGNWKPVTGVTLGLAVFVLTCLRPARPTAVEELTRLLIVVHAAALVTQFAWYRLTGAILNFHALTGGDPRLVGAFFRPAGLFLEPSLFSVCMTMLVMLRFRVLGRLDRYCLVGLASMLLSLSLLGVAASTYLLVRARPVLGLTLVSLVVAAGALAVAQLPRDSAIYGLILARVTNLGSDSSAQYRFGGLLGSGDEAGVVSWLLGGGIGYDYVALGSSGVGFLISSVGVAGLLLFLAGLALAAHRRDGLTAPLDVLFLMLGAPFWTFFLWWWWLATVLSVRGHIRRPRPETSGLRPRPTFVSPAQLNVQPD